jgi:hypothetical protein
MPRVELEECWALHPDQDCSVGMQLRKLAKGMKCKNTKKAAPKSSYQEARTRGVKDTSNVSDVPTRATNPPGLTLPGGRMEESQIIVDI